MVRTSNRSRTAETTASERFFCVNNLHIYYEERRIVQGISFDTDEGEILALLGRNGADRISTLTTIARLSNLEFKSSEIWFAGKPMDNNEACQAEHAGI